MYRLRGYPGQSEQVTGNGGGKGRKGQEAGSNNNNRHPTNQREWEYVPRWYSALRVRSVECGATVSGGDARADWVKGRCVTLPLMTDGAYLAEPAPQEANE